MNHLTKEENIMNKIKLDRNSWHYELASKWTDCFFHPADDLCSYRWQVFVGFMRVVLLTTFIALVIAWAIQPLIYLLACVVTGFYPSIMTSFGPSSALIIELLISAVIFLFMIGEYLRDKNIHPIRDNFITASIRSVKEKYCTKIEWN